MNVLVICERKDLIQTDLRFKTVHVFEDMPMEAALASVFGNSAPNIVGIEAIQTFHDVEVQNQYGDKR